MMRLSDICLPILLLAGCAQATSDAALGDLRTRLTDAQRKEADGRRRIDELENRVFLMSDQLESQKIVSANGRAPRLPVVTLRPTEESMAADLSPALTSRELSSSHELTSRQLGSREREREPEPAEEPQWSDSRDESVVRDTHRARPVLRGEGSAGEIVGERPTKKRERPSLSNASAASDVRLVAQEGGDSLGVAPVPPIPKTPSSMSVKAPLPAADHPPLDNEPLTAYRIAYAEVTAGHYEDAEHKLRAFVHRYPHHDYADNAQYWIGETFYARHLYREAAVEFRAAVAKYPIGNKAPDALLKLAYSLLSLGETAEARRLLEELPATYPRSEAARLATQKLAESFPSASRPVEEHR